MARACLHRFPGSSCAPARRNQESNCPRRLALVWSSCRADMRGWRALPSKCAAQSGAAMSGLASRSHGPLGPRSTRAVATLPVIQQCFLAPDEPIGDFEPRLFLSAQASGTRWRRRELISVRCRREPSFTRDCSRRGNCRRFIPTWPTRISRVQLRDFSSALFHQHPTQLVAGAAVPFCGAQRRDQHHQRQSALAAGAGARHCARSSALANEVRLLEEGVSDSASFDNALEILLRRGYRPGRRRCCAWFRRRGKRSSSEPPELCAIF